MKKRSARPTTKSAFFIKKLASRKPSVVKYAYEKLYRSLKTGHKRSLIKVRELLDHPNESVKRRAMVLLEKAKDKEAIPKILSLALEGNAKTRKSAIVGLSIFTDIEIIRPLIRVLAEPELGSFAKITIEHIMGNNTQKGERILRLHGLRSKNPLVVQRVEEILIGFGLN